MYQNPRQEITNGLFNVAILYISLVNQTTFFLLYKKKVVWFTRLTVYLSDFYQCLGI